jgi:hypothetical protein
MLYRLYLLDKRDRIRAAENFSAKSDNEAKEIASRVCNARDDSFKRYELWCGADQIMSFRCGTQTGQRRERRARDITPASQEVVLDLEERLQNSFACVTASRRLLEATAELRSRVYPYTDTSS